MRDRSMEHGNKVQTSAKEHTVTVMPIKKLLIANRGEIASRIARAAAELGIVSVAVYAEDDAGSLHVRKADIAHTMRGRGVAAYLDMAQLIEAAVQNGCDAIHPGYGFISENAEFARQCEAAGIRFVGPPPSVLELFGDKARARQLAERCRVPLLAGTDRPTSLEEAQAFLERMGATGAVVIKALYGGGGRGMRVVRRLQDLAEAYARCRSEAKAAFGVDTVYVERFVARARHIEIQVAGDGGGPVTHLWERECTLQRRNQKLMEIAPSPSLQAKLRERIIAAALTLAEAVNYRGLGTFEFLVDCERMDSADAVAFMEVNPRIQVEHTVTEEITGVDLVQTQLRLAAGESLADLGLTQAQIPDPRGYALQLRINLESMGPDGSTRPASGTIAIYEPPSGPGIRVDGCGYAGFSASLSYDSLVAKLIVHNPAADYPALLRRAYRALCEFRLEGVANNMHILQNLLRLPAVIDNAVHTRFIEENIEALLAPQSKAHRHLFFPQAHTCAPSIQQAIDAPAGCVPLNAPSSGMVVGVDVQPGDAVAAGQSVAVLEAMKMEFVVKATDSGIVRVVVAHVGDSVLEGNPLLFLEPAEIEGEQQEVRAAADLNAIRADLAAVIERHAVGLDERRPEAVAKRRKNNQRTARENIADLLDADSFIEYGALALAAQRKIKQVEELIKISPADGLIAGLGSINAAAFGEEAGRCMVLAYDYTVFSGTQGILSHKKIDRMLDLAKQWKTPLVLFAEGAGGRPHDTDLPGPAMLDVMTFVNMATLSGLMPLLGIVSGRCFAGNAMLLGCCDVIIATENSSIGMAGPAMIEGGSLGRFHPDEVGPVSIQGPNGVIDVLVKDEVEAVRVAKQYLSYFQGSLRDWRCADQRRLRQLIPENRKRIYDIRTVIETLADTGSVLELRREFAPGMITALIRIEGVPFGLIANNPQHLGGAIDSVCGDKAARFMQVCDAFDLPMVSLCDTPGFMVGPEAEKSGTVRHVSRMMVTAGSLSVPFFTVVLRKGYGLGAQAMAAGSFHSPVFIVAWPSSEFGPMSLEGAVRMVMGKQLDAIADPESRQKAFDQMLAYAYEQGKGINMASFLEIDDVIDPMETRRFLTRGLASMPKPTPRPGKKRSFIDTW
jgi:acetyl/propionyl-CoA carboxylase alpha subunit/acetyl-CoA carboxylase carboxyltransferase component